MNIIQQKLKNNYNHLVVNQIKYNTCGLWPVIIE